MKTGGAVKKAADGGFLKDKAGKGYAGFPHSPKSEKGSKLSAHKEGGAVQKKADGGGITLTKKLQLGGGTGLGGGLGQGQAAIGQPGGSGLMGLFPGRQPVPAQQGAPNLSGRPMIPAQPAQTAQMPRMASSVLARPAPGTTATYAADGGDVPAFKKGGAVPHGDEKEDRKLFGKMMKEKGMKKGGLVGPIYHKEGVGKRAKGGLVGRTLGTRTPESGSVNPGKNQTARGLAGSTYHQQGKGLASGGVVSNETGGASGGKSRLARSGKA